VAGSADWSSLEHREGLVKQPAAWMLILCLNYRHLSSDRAKCMQDADVVQGSCFCLLVMLAEG